MHTLNDSQLGELRKFLALTKEASRELGDSFSTGLMSDSKSAVYAVKTAAAELDMPEELASQLQQMAEDSWQGAVSMGEVYTRAGSAIGAIGRLQRLIESVFETNELSMREG